MKIKLLIISLLFVFKCSLAKDMEPVVPYYEWGFCIGEKCEISGEWRVTDAITTYKKRDINGQVAFKLRKDDTVTAITEVIISSKIGVVKVNKPIKLHVLDASKDFGDIELKVKQGDIIYNLRPWGEGFDLCQFKGKRYLIELPPLPEYGYVTSQPELQVISEPEYVEWVKLKNHNGQVGWALRENLDDHSY